MTVSGKDRRELVQEIRTLRTHLGRLERRNAERTKFDREPPESLEQFKAIFDDSPVGLYRSTPDGRILMANSALVNMLGYRSFDELARRNIQSEGYEPACSQPAFRHRIEREGKVIGLESAWKKSDGTMLHVRESAQAVRDELGNILYHQGAVEDVTEQKQAEEALHKAHDELEMRVQQRTAELRRTNEALQAEIAERLKTENTPIASELQYRTTLDSMADAIHVVDSQLRIVLLNERFRKWGAELGFDVAHSVGRTIFELFPFLPETVRDEYRRVFEEGRVLTTEETTRIAGEEITTETRKIPIRQGDRVVRVVTVIRDITDRKKAEHALKVSEERFRLAQQASQTGVWERNLKTDEVYWSQNVEPMFGMKPGSFGQNFEAFLKCILPEDRKRVEPEVSAAIKEGRGFTVEYRIAQPDGGIRWMTEDAQVFNDLEGKPTRLVGTVRDITEHKKTQDALLQSEALFRAFMDNLPGYAYIKDAQHRHIFANRRFKDKLGLVAQDILGKNNDEVFGPEVAQRLNANDEMVLRTGQTFEAEEMMAESGEPHHFISHKFSITGLVSPMVGGISVDVTERRQAEKTLRETTGLLETMFAHTHILVAYLDPQFNFVRVNRAYAEADGREPSFFVGRNHFDLYPHRENEAIFRKVVEIGVPYFAHARPFEYAEHPERKVSYWDWSLVPIKQQDGAVCGLVLTLVNVTEQKEAERALREREATLTSIFRAAPVGIGLERDHVLARVNDQVCSMLGYSREELVGQRTVMFYPTEDHYERVRQESQPQILERGTATVETQWKRKDGRIIDVLLSTTVLDPADFSKGVTFTALDISERKAAEESLRESEEKFRSLAEQSPNMIYINKKGRVVYANRKCEEIMGFTREEFYAPDFDFRALVAPESADVIRESFTRHLGGQDIEPYDYCLISKQGRRIEAINASNLIQYEGETAILGIVTDITDRKQAERRLQLSEERLKRAQSMALIGNWEWDLQKGTLHWEEENYRMFGLPRETVPSVEGFLATVHPDDLELVKRSMDAAINNGEPYDLDFRIRRPEDGTERVIHANGEVTWDAEGKPMCFFGTVQDVTERKKAERSLRESQERLKILFESAPDAIYVTDLEGRFVDGNRAAEEMVGFTKSEVIGKSLAESGILSGEELSKAAANLRKVAAGEPSGPSEYAVRRKNGSMITVEVRTFPVRIGGEILSLGIARDVTARKHAEEAIRANEKKFRSIFETAANLITSVNEQGIIIDCNNRVRQFLGYEKEELLGRSMAKIIHPDYLGKAQNTLKEILTQGFSYNKEYKMVRKDGSLIDVSIDSSAIEDEHGKYTRTLCIIDDMTDYKQAQQKLLDDREQLKSLASQLSLTEERERHRLAGVLHDQIGQSLVISKIKLDQLRRGGTAGAIVKALDEVAACLGQVISDTRTLTFDLSYPILYELGFESAVAEWLTEHIQEKHGIETDFEDDGQPKPLDDDIRALLFRNVRELLINVVKHARARRVKVTTRRLKDQIRTSVEDDGVGFDPVEVTAMAAKRAEFGLFSIRERLEQLGGLFEVVSAPGRGTRITMTAPLKRTANEEQG